MTSNTESEPSAQRANDSELQRAIVARALAQHAHERKPRPIWTGKLLVGIVGGLAIAVILFFFVNFMLTVLGRFFATPIVDPPQDVKTPYMISVDPPKPEAPESAPRDEKKPDSP
jgi:hypothetical protein